MIRELRSGPQSGSDTIAETFKIDELCGLEKSGTTLNSKADGRRAEHSEHHDRRDNAVRLHREDGQVRLNGTARLDATAGAGGPEEVTFEGIV
ncbi:hypothetical protein SRHO_G00101440 [Serrasalmus rhombeus]